MRTIFTLFFIIALAGKLLAGQDDRGYLVRIGQEAPDIELIYPDGEGKIKFTLHRNQGDYIALNALKMEEYSNL